MTRQARDRPEPRFHFIGGKGGVGKTTCAAAFALAEAAGGLRVLIASTDPAPSLGDAFKVRLGAAPRRVPLPKATLFAVEIDAAPVLKRWIGQRRETLERIALQGTWLDREDVTRILGLSLPGIDEIAALLEISRLARTGRYDLLIVDTAPTGHTLRMLDMPETLFALARVFDQMREKHRIMVEALRGGWRPEREDVLIDELAVEARALAGLLRDRERTRISWVTLPEPMAVAESAAAFDTLRQREIRISDVILNRVTPAPPSRCDHCDARRALEARASRALPPGIPVVGVYAQETEPRGVAALRRIAKELHRPADPRRVAAGRRTWTAGWQSHRRMDVARLAPSSTQLLMFGGKGGVGKTTCAAAAAIAVAEKQPRRRILLISTDPAHSLSDVLGVELTNEAIRVKGTPSNLAARELDATQVLEDVRRRYAAAIDDMFDRFASGRSFDMTHDRAVMHALIELAPPGLDELVATTEITDALTGAAPRWDLVVVDTAPTGHALRLLEMPALIHDWTKALMSILLKYQAVAGLGRLGPLLLQLSRGLGRLRDLLSDPARTRFIVVTRAAALPRAESVRLLSRLEQGGIDVPAVVVNAVGRGDCARCRRAAAAEHREIARLRRALAPAASGRTFILAATQIPAPAGASQLRRWQRDGWTA